MLEDLEQLLRLRMTGPMTNNTCQALAAVALSSPQSSLGVESFCEGVYEQLVRLLEPITTVPHRAHPHAVHTDQPASDLFVTRWWLCTWRMQRCAVFFCSWRVLHMSWCCARVICAITQAHGCSRMHVFS